MKTAERVRERVDTVSVYVRDMLVRRIVFIYRITGVHPAEEAAQTKMITQRSCISNGIPIDPNNKLSPPLVFPLLMATIARINATRASGPARIHPNGPAIITEIAAIAIQIHPALVECFMSEF